MSAERALRTRMGDGSLVEMTRSEIRADVEAASETAARRAKVDPLGPEEVDHLVDIFASEARFTGVDIGHEVVLSFDGSGNEDVGSMVDQILVYQNHHGADALEVGWIDYSFRAAKTILEFQAQQMREVQQRCVAPCFYGSMPDLGRYSKPDGPVPNWSELMPLARIDEARAAQEEAIELLVSDVLFVDRDHGRGRRRRHRLRHRRRGRRRGPARDARRSRRSARSGRTSASRSAWPAR